MQATATGGRILRRTGLAALALSVLVLAGCGNTTPDPGAKRPQAQAEQLRERLFTVQGAT